MEADARPPCTTPATLPLIQIHVVYLVSFLDFGYTGIDSALRRRYRGISDGVGHDVLQRLWELGCD